MSSETEEEYRFFEVIQSYLSKAAEVVDLPQHVREILSQPKNELIVHFPVTICQQHSRWPTR